MEKVEGIYTYRCNNCESVFGIVARFGVLTDKVERVQCPKCKGIADIYGEGHIKYTIYELDKKDEIDKDSAVAHSNLSDIMDVNFVANTLGISKRVAYEVMKQTDFPKVKIRRRKWVKRGDFFDWLDNQKEFEYKK